MRPEQLAAGAQDYARHMLQVSVDKGRFSRNTGRSNFPPAVFVPLPAGAEKEAALVAGFHENQRFAAIRQALRQSGADRFCLVYDGRVSKMGHGKCEFCDGKGCEECVGSGRYRDGDKRDAIVTVEMKRGEEPRVSYTGYAVLGDKVIFEKPITMGEDMPGATGQHGYGVVWEQEKETSR